MWLLLHVAVVVVAEEINIFWMTISLMERMNDSTGVRYFTLDYVQSLIS